MWLVFRGTAHIEYRQLHKKYGNIVRTAPRVVDISDPDAIPIIYGISSKFIKSPFYRTMDMSFEDKVMPSLFTTISPDEHKELKRPVAQKFSMTSIRSLEHLVDPCSEIFTEAMEDLQGEVVDLGVWLQWYAFDVIGSITFAKRFGFMEKREDVKGIISAIEWVLMYAGIVGQVPWLHQFLLGSMLFQKLLRAVSNSDPMKIASDMVLSAIREHDSGDGSSDRSDFLAYLRQQQKSTGIPIQRREMMNHLLNNILAGSDTTAISLRAVFYYVIRDKGVYATLQKEVDEFEAAGRLSPVITYSESLDMPYLQICLKEAMRVHPGVSFPLERIVPKGGVRVSGKHLPEGTIVGMNAAVIHRNKEIFGEDADAFRPERWMGEEERVKVMDRHLLTFGAGARTCIGKNISIMEMGKLVPQVLRQFELEWASEKPDWNVRTYWFARQQGLLVRFKSRKA
ncbi:putative P450 monooxygenase [Ilyonectria robusta]|uniref:putative P450 monooxygenase n=1 Tax=Ilyonectria robusta TaxID=1079257 RepID=UPI001E8EB1EF|nr:putative P450 monooxygenase [Ilyonectria robusta]KAH8652879.1 putative P450 monooxygenase [Ilyonectria robusta]